MTEHLWTIDHIAEFFQCERTAAEHIASGHGFPAPIILPSRGKGARPPKRWDPPDVRAFAATLKKAA